jgi:hypothetical protein
LFDDPPTIGSALNRGLRAHTKCKANLKEKFDRVKPLYILLFKNYLLEN